MIRLAASCGWEGGWGRHARCFASALDRHEPTELVDLDTPPAKGPKAWIERSRLRFSMDSAGISLGALEHTPTLGTRYRIAFCTSETTAIPIPHLFYLYRADMVWSMSSWGRELLERHGLSAEKIRVVPAGVDTTVFTPPLSERQRGKLFRFLCVGKWEERKGTADLVRAFSEEFDPAEPEELVMHCGTSWARKLDFRQEIAQVLASTGRNGARIVPSDPVELRSLVDLMQSCHAFVLPTRGEAWGLPILEAMACELPCIVTDYSGPTEYANEDNCYLIRVQEMRKVEDTEFFYSGYDWGMWAQPDLAHLRSLMRFVYENPEDARRKARRAREDAVKYWTWDLAAEKAVAHIQELRRGKGA